MLHPPPQINIFEMYLFDVHPVSPSYEYKLITAEGKEGELGGGCIQLSISYDDIKM